MFIPNGESIGSIEVFRTIFPHSTYAAKINSVSERDATADLALPKKYLKRLQTTNSLEQLNGEIRRSERVIRIFPNRASVVHLMSAFLMEIDEKALAEGLAFHGILADGRAISAPVPTSSRQ